MFYELAWYLPMTQWEKCGICQVLPISKNYSEMILVSCTHLLLPSQACVPQAVGNITERRNSCLDDTSASAPWGDSSLVYSLLKELSQSPSCVRARDVELSMPHDSCPTRYASSQHRSCGGDAIQLVFSLWGFQLLLISDMVIELFTCFDASFQGRKQHQVWLHCVLTSQTSLNKKLLE